MKTMFVIAVVASLVAFSSPPAKANFWTNLTPVQRTEIIGGGVLLTGAIIYNNERVHHRVDNANASVVEAYLASHPQQQQAQAIAGPASLPQSAVLPIPNTMRLQYEQRMVCNSTQFDGQCATYRVVNIPVFVPGQ